MGTQPKSIRLTSIGPLPPPLGGTTVLFEDYVSRISSLVDRHQVIDTTDMGKGFFRFVREIRTARRVCLAPLHSDIVALHASVARSFVYGALLYVLSALTGTRVIVRCFGGGHDIFMRDPPFYMLWFETLMFRNSLILLETKHLCRWAAERHPKARIDWHPNCREFADGFVSDTPRDDRFIFLGKVSSDKGIDTILRMRERWPNDPFTIEIAGALDGTISEARLKNAIGAEYLGVINPSEASKRLGRCKALLLPTRYSGEGYPGVILEAYAHRTPVIATRWRAIPEIVVDGSTGLLFDVDSEEQMRHAILRVIQDKQLYNSMRAQAEKAAKEFRSSDWHGTKWSYWLSLVFNNESIDLENSK